MRSSGLVLCLTFRNSVQMEGPDASSSILPDYRAKESLSSANCVVNWVSCCAEKCNLQADVRTLEQRHRPSESA